VIGGGVVGCLLTYLLGRSAAVELVDENAARGPIGKALGAQSFATPNQAQREVDLIFHASGSAAGLRTALQLAGYEGRIIELSWYGDQKVELPLGEAFHSRRLRIISSQVGGVAQKRMTHRERLQVALSHLNDSVLDLLLDGETAFDELDQAYPKILSRTGALCHRVRYH
jgi:threonine dehydrogenase-like Zn-dependent dehydrogenase